MQEPAPDQKIVLTEAQLAARRKRSVALALAIGALCLLFYFITVFKMGAAIMKRPM